MQIVLDQKLLRPAVRELEERDRAGYAKKYSAAVEDSSAWEAE